MLIRNLLVLIMKMMSGLGGAYNLSPNLRLRVLIEVVLIKNMNILPERLT